MRALARIVCLVLAGVLAGCGGSGGESGGTSSAPGVQDARLVLDSMSWDQGSWGD